MKKPSSLREISKQNMKGIKAAIADAKRTRSNLDELSNRLKLGISTQTYPKMAVDNTPKK